MLPWFGVIVDRAAKPEMIAKYIPGDLDGPLPGGAKFSLFARLRSRSLTRSRNLRSHNLRSAACGRTSGGHLDTAQTSIAADCNNPRLEVPS